MRVDPTFQMEVRWCADAGIPHSEFLSWSPADRSKVIALLTEDAKRCSMCGTSPWEWEEDKWAYTPAAHTCQGCKHLDAAREDNDPGPGTRMVLIPRERAAQLGG